MDSVVRVLQDAVDSGVTAGAVALVRHRGETVLHSSVGDAAKEHESSAMAHDTVFDLASLTKPMVGATVALALVDRGVFSLDEEVTRFLPELDSVRGRGVTFRRLLSHSSGIAGWHPLYVWSRGRDQVLDRINRLGLVASPGSRFEYTDIGFMTLGLALERAGGDSLDRLAEDLVFGPLGLQRTGYRLALPTESFAMTEMGNVFERRMAEWAGLDFDGWRTDFYPGEVNDGNAHYALDGISAHAGLFSDAAGVAVVGQMWCSGGEFEGTRILSDAVVDVAVTEHSPDKARRGLGWQLMASGGPSLEHLTRVDAGYFPPVATPFTPRPSGELMGPRSFGHTGFTGTSLWVDPEKDLVATLLANATHPDVDLDRPVNAMRARFHNAVVAAIAT